MCVCMYVSQVSSQTQESLDSVNEVWDPAGPSRPSHHIV